MLNEFDELEKASDMGDIQYCKDCKFWNGDWISPVRRLCTHPLTSGDFVTGMYYWCFYFDSRPSQYDVDNPVVAYGWVLCRCGDKHRLIHGIDAPVYWCGSELLKLKEGDDVEVEELESNSSVTTAYMVSGLTQ